MLRTAVACMLLASVMTIWGNRPVTVMFAVVGTSFAVAYLLHRGSILTSEKLP